VDGAIGELSPFHESFGYYAQGVSVTTAVLPRGWQERVVRWSNHSTGQANAAFLEPHDCAVSKLVAHRDKDRAFVSALLQAGLLDPQILLDRINALPENLDKRLAPQLRSWLSPWLPTAI